MGIGMVLAVAPEKKEQVLALLNEQNEAAYVIGKATEAQEHAVLFTKEIRYEGSLFCIRKRQ